MNADYIDFKVEAERLVEMGYERGALNPLDMEVALNVTCEHCGSGNVTGAGFRRYAENDTIRLVASYVAYLVCGECGYASEF